jgi:hypothetical protein
LEQLKEYDHDMFFEVVLSLFLEEQGQAAPDLSEKLKRMNLSYMTSRGPQDGGQITHDVVKTMLDLGLISQQNMSAPTNYFHENQSVSLNCVRVMMDRLRVNNVHAKAPVDLTEGERAEAAKLYRLWTGHYFPHLEAWVRDTQTAKTPVNFMEWLHNWCRLMNHCAEQRRFALQAGFFTESPVRNSGKGSTNSSTSAKDPKQGNTASKKRNAPEPAPKRGQGGTSNADRSLCEGCGKIHAKGLSLAQIGKGHTSDCQFHRHPDFNKSGKPWKESTVGKALATQPEGYQSLSHNYQLVNGVWQRVKESKPTK